MSKQRFPIFIPSKGRYNSLMTATCLEKMGMDYFLVVEPQEYDLYAENLENKTTWIGKETFGNTSSFYRIGSVQIFQKKKLLQQDKSLVKSFIVFIDKKISKLIYHHIS